MADWWEDWKRKWGAYSDDDFREANPDFYKIDEQYGNSFAERNPQAMEEMKAKSGKMGLEKRQKLFQLAAEGGETSGGPWLPSHGTSGIGYADAYDPSKSFPNALSKEEEEYMRSLRAFQPPGLFTV